MNGAQMKFNTYLAFNGNCGEAFKFYEQCLGGKTEMMKWGDSPMADQTDAASKDKIMHARLQVGDQTLMGADSPKGMFNGNQGFSVAIHVTDPAEAEKLFNALTQGGKVHMPLGKTFWSPAFGMFIDRFGIPWMVNCEQHS
jgi:PhnB protein